MTEKHSLGALHRTSLTHSYLCWRVSHLQRICGQGQKKLQKPGFDSQSPGSTFVWPRGSHWQSLSAAGMRSSAGLGFRGEWMLLALSASPVVGRGVGGLAGVAGSGAEA